MYGGGDKYDRCEYQSPCMLGYLHENHMLSPPVADTIMVDR